MKSNAKKPTDGRWVQMRRSRQIDGVWVCFIRSIAGWMTIFDADFTVFYRQPFKGGRWFVRRRHALEDIGSAETLADAVRLAIRHNEQLKAEARARVNARIRRFMETPPHRSLTN